MMKILISNPDKTLGLVIPDPNTIQEIGLFDPELIEAQIAALGAFNAFTKNVGTPTIKLALVSKGNVKCLAMRPTSAEGDAWVVLAPRIKAD